MNGSSRHDLIVFDGDDTLWRTQEIYDAIKAQFVELLASEGLNPAEALSTLDKIDAEAAGIEGFTVGRFLNSMVRTYLTLADHSSHEPSAVTQSHIEELVRPLLGGYELYPDTVAVLTRLRLHFRLALATKGQQALQYHKIETLGIASFFDHVYVVERKTENEYRLILKEYRIPAQRAWAVGNSVRSDINPALRIGMHAIWIRRRTWLYEEAALLSHDVVAVDSLSDAGDALLSQRRRLLGVSP